MEKWTVSEILDILVQSWTLKFHKVKLLEFKTFKFNQKYVLNWPFFHYEKFRRHKKSPQLLGATMTRVWHHHGNDTTTSPKVCILIVTLYSYLSILEKEKEKRHIIAYFFYVIVFFQKSDVRTWSYVPSKIVSCWKKMKN